jgi:hypothetical protein
MMVWCNKVLQRLLYWVTGTPVPGMDWEQPTGSNRDIRRGRLG